MSARERTETGAPGAPPDAGALAAEVRDRLTSSRLEHVESVVETAREIAARGGGSDATRAAVERAAWAHDAVKPEGLEAWVRRIEAAGETPDPWALAHAPVLLHAPAAAAWLAARGEADPEVLGAVRHHPTAHPDWGDVGRILYVADFCEPGRDFAREAGTAALRKTAAEGPEGLAAASRAVLALRLRWLLDRGGPVHPDSWRAWNAWTGGGG